MPRQTKLAQATYAQAEKTFQETMEMVAEAIHHAQVALALGKPRDDGQSTADKLELTTDQLDLLRNIVWGLTQGGSSYGWWTDKYTEEDFIRSVGMVPEYLD
jgi:hypothetical protein